MIETEEDYQAALALVDPLIKLDPILGSWSADVLEHLVTLIEEYELGQLGIGDRIMNKHICARCGSALPKDQPNVSVCPYGWGCSK